MKAIPLSSPGLPAPWAEVLDNLEETLRRTEAAASERQRAISACLSSAQADQEQWQEGLSKLQQLIEAWPVPLEQSEKEAAEADAVLDAALDSLQKWCSEAEALVRGLAKWAAPSV